MATSRTRRPTILDVAQAAGVSKSLVSLALRGDRGVGDQTRDRIARTAEELGYRSNALARGLVQGRTMLFGALLTDLGNPYHTDVVAGVEGGADQAGFGVLLGHGRRDAERLAGQLDAMVQLNVEGIVVVSSWIDPDALASAARRLPVVVVGRPERMAAGVDTIAGDDAVGAAQAVEHLSELGHARIAFVTASTRPAASARRDGYLAAMAAHGLKQHACSYEGADQDQLDQAISRLLASGATAVLTNNDLTAIRLLDRASEAGVDVPSRLAVVGYDNSALATVVRPRLTSVDQPRQAMGEVAVKLLLERMDGRTRDRHEVLKPTLVCRASTVRSAEGRSPSDGVGRSG